MSGHFRAVAVDYDGTLTEGARPDDTVLTAIADLRQVGVLVILATGRILNELRHAFPDVDAHFDCIVAENGCLISGPHGRRLLADPVDAVLQDALLRRHVPVRAGDVLLACDAAHDHVVLEEIGRLGLDCQILRNRGALMVLPAGVTKGTGLLEALGDLGVSRHSTITVGDAENDRRLLESCEFGVAVANAVETLKEHADLVLEQPDGAGVAGLLRGPILRGERRTQSARWRVRLGTDREGRTVTLPASQINMLVAGGTGMGKSYLAGLLAEQVSELGYSALVIDVEGDHLGLDDLRGVLSVGGTEPLPKPADVHRLVRHRFGSVVLDLSLLAPHLQDSYLSALPAIIEHERCQTGLPHWVFLDEAHRLVGTDPGASLLHHPTRGHCLVSYRPEQLVGVHPDHLDVVILTPGLDADQIPPLAEATGRRADHLLRMLDDTGVGDAILIEPANEPDQDRRFRVGVRRTSHVRHWHKYARGPLDPHLHFHFRTAGGEPTGSIARSLHEFHHIIRQCPPEVLGHHLGHGDLSRWIRSATRDDALSASFAATEAAHPSTDIERAREHLLRAIEHRYLE